VNVGTGLVLLLVCVLTACSGDSARPAFAKPTIYLVDDGGTGWVRIIYNQKNAGELPIENNFVIARIPRGGRLLTRSRMNPSWDGSEFFYMSAEGKRIPLQADGEKDRRIWAKEKTSDPKGDHEDFFIGTEAQASNRSQMSFVGSGFEVAPNLLK
jgi:hypothetical protein